MAASFAPYDQPALREGTKASAANFNSRLRVKRLIVGQCAWTRSVLDERSKRWSTPASWRVGLRKIRDSNRRRVRRLFLRRDDLRGGSEKCGGEVLVWLDRMSEQLKWSDRSNTVEW